MHILGFALLLTLFGDDEGSSMCAALAPPLIPTLAEALLVEAARRRELEAEAAGSLP
jgi:hypothetical protein